jgi:Ca-activated chloride channel family protein
MDLLVGSAPAGGGLTMLHFGHPWVLLILPALVVLVLLAVLLRRRAAGARAGAGRAGGAGAGRAAALLGLIVGASVLRGRNRLWAALHVIAVCLLVVGLADPQLRSGARRPTVLAVDESASISSASRTIEHAWADKAQTDDCVSPCRVVRFAGAARVTAPSARGQAADAPDDTQTDLAGGISAAVGLAPSGGRVVVLSDGGQTEGDVLATAALARQRNVAVDWVTLGVGNEQFRDASITAISAPAAVHLGDTVPLSLTVYSSVVGTAVLGVSSDGTAPRSQSIALRPGDNPLLLFYTAAHKGWHSFTATVAMSGDAIPANNSRATVTDVLAAPRVIIAGGPSSAVPRVLAGKSLLTKTVKPTALPTAAAGYAGADSVVLDDVAASQLNSAQITALSRAVRSGGLGLVTLGGPHSFSLGRYAKSPLQQILPVASLIPGNLQRRNLAIELVLDRSGSMTDLAGGVPKIEMARAAARQTTGFIATHQDELGVVDFDIVPHTLVALQRVAGTKAAAKIDKVVTALQADGGTNIYLGLKAGLAQLLKSKAKERHMILLTDGISQPENYNPLLTQLVAAHISVATVALGSDADRTLLAQIAASTGGHAYVTNNAKDLPKIFAKETQLSAKPVKVTGHLSVVVNSDSPVVRSLAQTKLPALTGNVVVQIKDGAQADLLAGDAGATKDPALAEWQIGSGRVVSWTPGLGAPWASAWLGETAFWNDAVRWTERGVSIPALTPQAVGAGRLQIDLASEGTDALTVTAIKGTLTGPHKVATPVTFSPTGPGLFTADVQTLPSGAYDFALSTEGGQSLTNSGEVALPYPAEYSPVSAKISPLAQLVAQTGGRVIADTDERAIRPQVHSLRWLLTLIALVAFLIGVVGRMLPELRARGQRRGPPGVSSSGDAGNGAGEAGRVRTSLRRPGSSALRASGRPGDSGPG